MTNLQAALEKHLPDAWDRTPVPDTGFDEDETLATPWDNLSESTQDHLTEFTRRTIVALPSDGVLAELSKGQDITTWTVDAEAALDRLRSVTELADLPTRLDQATELQQHLIPDSVFQVLMNVMGKEQFNIDHLRALGEAGIFININSLRDKINDQDDDVVDAVVHCEGCRDNERQLVGDIRDVRRGDMLQIEADTHVLTYKYAVKSVNLSDGGIVFDNGGYYGWDDRNTVYRLPRPIVHPSPAEHPVIIVRESTVLPKGSEPQKVMFVRPYYRNDIWAAAPDTITDWEPADIVPAGGTP